MWKLFDAARDGSLLDAVRETENGKWRANFLLLLMRIVFLFLAQGTFVDSSEGQLINGALVGDVLFYQPQCTERGCLSVARFCYSFLSELRGPAWAVGT